MIPGICLRLHHLGAAPPTTTTTTISERVIQRLAALRVAWTATQEVNVLLLLPGGPQKGDLVQILGVRLLPPGARFEDRAHDRLVVAPEHEEAQELDAKQLLLLLVLDDDLGHFVGFVDVPVKLLIKTSAQEYDELSRREVLSQSSLGGLESLERDLNVKPLGCHAVYLLISLLLLQMQLQACLLSRILTPILTICAPVVDGLKPL